MFSVESLRRFGQKSPPGCKDIVGGCQRHCYAIANVVLSGFSFYCLTGRKSVVVYFKSINKCANIPTGGSEEVRGKFLTT